MSEQTVFTKEQLTAQIFEELPQLEKTWGRLGHNPSVVKMVKLYNEHYAPELNVRKESVGCAPCVRKVLYYFQNLKKQLEIKSSV